VVVAVTAVVQDGPLGGERRRGQDYAGEPRSDEHGAPTSDAGDHVHRVAPPVHGSVAQHAREVGEHVHADQHAPSDETERVQRSELAAAVPDHDHRDAGSEERERRRDE
jgi:hypothetical protein